LARQAEQDGAQDRSDVEKLIGASTRALVARAIAFGYRTRFTASEGVVILGVAQEKMRSFKAQ
jgi:hypothetical protein